MSPVRLPKLRSDLVVKREVAANGVVVLLSAPGVPARRVSERVYRALEVLDLYDDAPAWAVGVGDPELTPSRLQQLADLLAQGGLVEPRGDTAADIIVVEQDEPDDGNQSPTVPLTAPPRVDSFAEPPPTQMTPWSEEKDDAESFLDDRTAVLQAPDPSVAHALMRPEQRPLPVPVAPEPREYAPAPQADAAMVVDPVSDVDASVSAVRASPEALRMRRQRRIVRLLAAGGIAAVLFGAATLLQASLTVSSDAELLPLEMSTVRSALDGVVAEVLVDEGQRVRTGDVLARLAAGEHRVALARSEAAVKTASTELTQLLKGNRVEEVDRVRARVNGLNREVNIAGARVDRLAQQVKQGIAPREELDQARGQHAALSGQLAEANAELRLMLAGAPPEEIAAKESELKTLTAQLEEDKKALDATVVKSRMNGVVVTPKPKEKVNARVAQGDALFEVVESQRMKAEVLISERDFDVLTAGLPLEIKVPAYPGRTFSGKVTKVAQRVEMAPKLGAVVRVEGEIDNPEGLLVPNMTGIGVIDCGRRSWAEILVRRAARWFRLHVLL